MDKKMKILIITYYFPPLNNFVGSLRPYSWAKYWSRDGHDVTVLTTKREKQDNDFNLDFSGFKVIEVENRFEMTLRKIFGREKLISSNRKNKTSLKNKFLNKIKIFIQKRGLFGTVRMPDFNDVIIKKAFKKVSDTYWDLVVSTAGPYTEHLIALKLKKAGKSKFWIADYRDLWTMNHIFKGLFPFTLIEEYLEKRVNSSADMITTVSEPLAKQIRKKYKLTNVEIIENGFDLEDLERIPKDKFWNDNKVRLVYTGSIYQGKQDPSPLFEAISNIGKNDITLLENLEVIFVGGNKGNLDDLINKYDVKKWVKYEGFLKREDALRMQRDAHALIFLEFEDSNVDGILTGKLFEYLYSGTQILGIGTTDTSAPGKIIKESGHGINFGKDSKKLERHLTNLLKAGIKPQIKVNTKVLDRYSRKNLAKKMLELVDKYQIRRKYAEDSFSD